MNAWFNFKVGIVMWGRIYVTRRLLMVILDRRNPNCWSFEVVLLVSTQGSQGLSQKLAPFADEFDPGPLRGRGQKGGGIDPQAALFASPEIWFHVCWFAVWRANQ